MGKAGSAANMAIKGAGYGAVAGAGAGTRLLVDEIDPGPVNDFCHNDFHVNIGVRPSGDSAFKP